MQERRCSVDYVAVVAATLRHIAIPRARARARPVTMYLEFAN